MEKKALYRYGGRDLGLRHALAATAEELDKTADVDEEILNSANDLAGSIEYIDELNKRAHNIGLFTGYQQVIDQIEAGVPAEKIASQLTEAMEAKEASATFPVAESDEEAAAFVQEMVKGAAEGIASITGHDPESEVVLSAAQDVVSQHLDAAE